MDSVLKHAMGMVDGFVEVYLCSVIAPFLKLHEVFYGKLNRCLRELIEKHGPLPKWMTANFITYARTVLVFPCLWLMSLGHRLLPALIVLLVDFGDFLDGVVARYWVDFYAKKDDAAAAGDSSPRKNSDEDGFQVVSTGSTQLLPSWSILQRNKTYGGFVDAVCDKAFLIPCWIYLFSLVPSTTLAWLQYLTLTCLITAETAGGSVRFRAFYTSPGIPAPTVKNLDFSTSAVKADHVGKAKQTFEMLGTTFFLLPYLRCLGLLLLFCAAPLAYESVRRKIKTRVIYVDYGHATQPSLDHTTLKFWMQAKGLGSKLIVGISNEASAKPDQVKNARAVSSVDQVMAEAPSKIDLRFLKVYGIDYVVCRTTEQQAMVGEDVVEEKRCLVIGDEGEAVLLEGGVGVHHGKKD